MRELRFRAWDGKKMHYDVFPWKHDFVISTAWHRCEASTGPGPLGSGGDTAVMMVPAVRFTELMQFTGLLDMNGKEIYEGDILHILYNGLGNRVIKFQGGGFDCAGYDLSRSKVIGNIYEHPSLLTAE